MNGSVPNRLLMSSYRYGAASPGSGSPDGSVSRSVGKFTVPALTLGIVAAAVAVWAPGAEDPRSSFDGSRDGASGQMGGAALRESDAPDGGRLASTQAHDLGLPWTLGSLLTSGDGIPSDTLSNAQRTFSSAEPRVTGTSDSARLVEIQSPVAGAQFEVAPSSDTAQGALPLQEAKLPIPQPAECLGSCDAIQGDLGAGLRAVASAEAVTALVGSSPPGPSLMVDGRRPQVDRAAGELVASVGDGESPPLAAQASGSEIAAPESLALVADQEVSVVPAPPNAEQRFEGQGSPNESQGLSQASQVALADAPAIGTRPAVAEPRPGRIEEPSGKDTVTPGVHRFSVEAQRPAAAGRLVETVSVATAGQDVSLGVSSVEIAEGELVSIKLGDLISLFEDRLERPLFVWMSSSMAAEKYVTPETLAAAGLAVSFDPVRGQVVLAVSD